MIDEGLGREMEDDILAFADAGATVGQIAEDPVHFIAKGLNPLFPSRVYRPAEGRYSVAVIDQQLSKVRTDESGTSSKQASHGGYLFGLSSSGQPMSKSFIRA